MNMCAVEGCEDKLRCRGMCRRHYDAAQYKKWISNPENRAKKNLQQRLRSAENKDYERQRAERYYSDPGHIAHRKAYLKQYDKDRPRRTAFRAQKKNAKRRGIAFLMTREEWIGWWGDDFEFRGKGVDDLQMCRYGDTGPYKLGNVYKASMSENREGARPLPVPEF